VLKIDDIISYFGIKEGTDALSKIPKLLHGMVSAVFNKKNNWKYNLKYNIKYNKESRIEKAE
jgi:hypothetical protein